MKKKVYVGSGILKTSVLPVRESVGGGSICGGGSAVVDQEVETPWLEPG